jgi:hypothetical protein
LTVYPNCDRELIRLIQAQNKTVDEWMQSSHMTPTTHHILMGLFDYVESVIIWFDSGMGISFVFGLPYILVYDLKMYWRHLNAKLANILQETRLRRFVMCLSAYSANDDNDNETNDEYARLRTCLPKHRIYQLIQETLADRSQELDVEIEQLRLEVHDFFENFRQAELVVTDMLSAIVLFWFLGLLGVGYAVIDLYGRGGNLLGIPLLYLIPLIIGIYLIPLGLFNTSIFQLQYKCLRLYADINSLVSNSKSSHKHKYLKTLELFNDQHSHQFRFLGGQLFSPTTMFKFISWTTTCIYILFSSSLIAGKYAFSRQYLL